MKLDAKTIAMLTLPAGRDDVIVFDDMLAGFGLRLRRGSADDVRRSWICQYRHGGGTRRLLLGSVEVLSVSDARLAARKALGKVALGQDPQGEKGERRGKDKLTLRSVIDDYTAAKKARARTLVEVKRYLGEYFKPLHGVPIDQMKRAEIAAQLVRIERAHGNVSAARARAALSAFFSWAMRMGLVEANPVIGVIKPEDHKDRSRVLSDEELAAIWRACGDDHFGCIIKLLMLTACRRTEIGGLRWSELVDGATLELPGERTKNGRGHSLPLPQLALDVLAKMPRMAERDLVFGLRGSDGFSRWVDGKKALDQRSGVRAWIIHDLRRTAATRMADLGVQPHVIETILNHVSGHRAGVAGVYNRSVYAREVRKALALWADHVRVLVEGGERKVLLLPGRA